MSEEQTVAAIRRDFIDGADRGLASGLVSALADEVSQHVPGIEAAQLLRRMNEAGPGNRLRMAARPVVEHWASSPAAASGRYDAAGRSAKEELISLVMAHTLAAPIKPDSHQHTPGADHADVARRMIVAARAAAVCIEWYEREGGRQDLDDAGPGQPLIDSMRAVGRMYQEILYTADAAHSAAEARRHAGLDNGPSPGAASKPATTSPRRTDRNTGAAAPNHHTATRRGPLQLGE
jgi:hypothetical protein